MNRSIAELDRNMAVLHAGHQVRYVGADTPPLRLGGLVYGPIRGNFRRLPFDPALPEAVDELAWCCAGVNLCFRSDSSAISVKVKLHHVHSMSHMARTGSSGFDLYIGSPKKRIFAGVSGFDFDADQYDSQLIGGLSRAEREYLIYFPLYSGVAEFQLGLDPDASLLPPSPWDGDHPVVIYGTSVTQGGCASRPGMAWTNILSRQWNLPVANFGFSGNGHGDAAVARQLAMIADPRCYLLDYELNARTENRLRLSLGTFLDILRAAHPKVPIGILSAPRLNTEAIRNSRHRDSIAIAERRFQQKEVENRQKNGDRNIHFFSGELKDSDWNNFTVDGVHPTDYGFARFVQLLEPQLRRLLK